MRLVEQILERALKRVVTKLPFRTIETDGRPYLTRFYVWPPKPRRGEAEPDSKFAVFIHFFHRGDEDRDQHNHPWSKSVSLILTGGYMEERGDGVHVLRPGMVNVINADDFHRVSLLKPKQGCWTLFVAGPRTNEWGFRDNDTLAFIPWREYLDNK